MNIKLHAVSGASGRPVRLFITAGQANDYICAVALMSTLPKVELLFFNRGYNADWFHENPVDKGTTQYLLGQKPRRRTIKYDKC